MAAWAVQDVTIAEMGARWNLTDVVITPDLAPVTSVARWNIADVTITPDLPPAPVTARWSVTDVTLTVGTVPALTATAPTEEVQGGDKVTITATADDGGDIDTLVITQTTGPAVALIGGGNTRTFTAPAIPAGATLAFKITGTRAGVTMTPATVTLTAAKHWLWVCDGTAWRAAHITVG